MRITFLLFFICGLHSARATAVPRHEVVSLHGVNWGVYKVFEGKKLLSCCLMGAPQNPPSKGDTPYVLLTAPAKKGPLTLSLFLGQPVKGGKKVKVSFQNQELWLHPAGAKQDTAWPEDATTQEQIIEEAIRDTHMAVSAEGRKGSLRYVYNLEGFREGYEATLKACQRSTPSGHGSGKERESALQSADQRMALKKNSPRVKKKTSPREMIPLEVKVDAKAWKDRHEPPSHKKKKARTQGTQTSPGQSVANPPEDIFVDMVVAAVEP